MKGRKGKKQRERERERVRGRERQSGIDRKEQGRCKNMVEESLRSKGISSKSKCLSFYIFSQYSIEGIGVRDRLSLL